jgi:HAD superfamily hydrolase (TIGR01509 family)
MTFGAIFDWDGVIIDSSWHHELSWEHLSKETGLPLPPGHFKQGFGMKNEFIIPNVLHWTNDPVEVQAFSLRKEELYRQIVMEHGIEALPGVVPWLETLRAATVPCAVGSSTHRANILTVLGVLGLETFFAAVVTGEDVAHGKPDPEVFLNGAARIAMAPASCVVFEDAFVGLEAAHRGGMKAVAVATTNPIESLTMADLAVHRLDELSLDRVSALWSR